MSERSTDLTNTFTKKELEKSQNPNPMGWFNNTSDRVGDSSTRGKWGVSQHKNNDIAIYLRVSSIEQHIDNQLPIIETYMKAHFPRFVNNRITNFWESIGNDPSQSRGFDIYWDHETGTTTNRKGFSVLYNTIQRKKYKHVVCWHVDRASRSIEDFSKLLRISRAAECTWHFASLNLSTADPMMEFMAKFFALWAEHEIALKDTRQREGIERRRKSGAHMGRLPNMQYDDEVFELMLATPKISISAVARHFNKSRDWARRTMKRVSERTP